MRLDARGILLIKAFHTLFAILIYQLVIRPANEASLCDHLPRRLRLHAARAEVVACCTAFEQALTDAAVSR